MQLPSLFASIFRLRFEPWKKVNDQLNYWTYFNNQNGNKIQQIVHDLTEKQTYVCGIISTMKATWLAVANSDQFLDGLEKEIKNENDQFVKLEEEVLNFLEPYEVAKEFLSWTLTQMPNATDSDYPEAGYDDIVLEEYLTGSG